MYVAANLTETDPELKAPQRRRVRFRRLVLGKMLRKHAASPQAIPPLVYAIEFMADFNPWRGVPARSRPWRRFGCAGAIQTGQFSRIRSPLDNYRLR
jgi:hypothetical protein